MSPQPTLLHPRTTAVSVGRLPRLTELGGRPSADTTVAPLDAAALPAPRRTPRQTPQMIARLHDAYYSAVWRGDNAASVADWFAAHWCEQAPPEPDGTPDAVSLFGGTGCGAGIRWYRRHDAILGYVPGARGGCYRIPVAEQAPVPPGLRHATHLAR